MTRINKISFVFVFLFGLGTILRVWNLGGLPWGFFRDEAALGYNAYSIWLTGKDEFGISFPLVFRSFEVFFLPLYVYLSAPIVGVFGLNDFTSRFLSSVSGIVALYFIYLIGKKIWNKETGIFTLFVLVISPWHIFYSRGAFEGNLALTLFTAGFYFWISFLKEKTGNNFFISTLLFTLSMYSYQAERLVVPLFALISVSLVAKDLWRVKQKLIFPSILTLFLLIPLLFISFKAGGYHRVFGVSVFSKEGAPPGWIEGNNASFFVNNNVYLRGKQILSLYASYFSPRNLFFEGDFDKQRSVENYSVFYSFFLPFLVIGLFSLTKKSKIEEKLILTWMFLGPLPASFTADPFHTYRSLMFYMPLTIIIGRGFYVFFQDVKKLFFWRNLFLIGLVSVSVLNLLLFLYNYTILTQVTRASYWDYGYRQLVTYINSLDIRGQVVVDDPSTEAYIHFLFFGKVEPISYHQEVTNLGPLDYYYTNPAEIRPNKIGNIEFRKIDWPKERGDSGNIFVFAKGLLPESEYVTDPKVELLTKIKYPDGTDAFTILKIK
ncbi:hypothetical protein A2715_05055 [Candidatus Woesebacteria bacterium RIFCSPHIGHO2_01_FULL_39_32]|uniref:Glycosyltransferase RgtA/B/C/D-like domain-containing protein n=1 Tax=Candidatus Woesebacteria bacterium RIFCSPLOWO2_01_FULL_39_25 TaxID=1802521 RepID=A0A1F8BNQ3_9BACT|nr:MAG: hypothetical protein A2124_05055 [Candidatus Woesebacteria bacterium GWB1_37_5]OGM25387.1 MAG: hypothetical protein A2715_05055 [Candidatus Woesebacteria bacterium RIFCSPHIGHO2_01_FULL_39_32]OGM38492.1 MAG: hypothetical protein A3F01_04010 [Candidatus Woesebacteria bacterium RIFCSPHIGHO2_12_FULL_38_11]OGM64918.1 MAG: hypothetical protein A2893_04665 [Candidatus Woesebacteria bacterium RIFCSPLOWO2_01_FULL_39_25]